MTVRSRPGRGETRGRLQHRTAERNRGERAGQGLRRSYGDGGTEGVDVYRGSVLGKATVHEVLNRQGVGPGGIHHGIGAVCAAHDTAVSGLPLKIKTRPVRSRSRTREGLCLNSAG